MPSGDVNLDVTLALMVFHTEYDPGLPMRDVPAQEAFGKPKQSLLSIYIDLGVVANPNGPSSWIYDMLCSCAGFIIVISCRPSGVTNPVRANKKVPTIARYDIMVIDLCTSNDLPASVRSINGKGDDCITAPATLHPLAVVLLLMKAMQRAAKVNDDMKLKMLKVTLMMPATEEEVMGRISIVSKKPET